MTDREVGRAVIDKSHLRDASTHLLAASFWEQLGRVVGTFGALEEVLGKAILALTGTRRIEEAEAPQALEVWGKTLEHALTDPLVPLMTRSGRQSASTLTRHWRIWTTCL